MAKPPPFRAALLTFFADLAANNDRDWFTANKARFEADVRTPLLAFIEAFAPKLHTISPHFVADSRANGGSMFRLHRDVRFSLDKSPYKTHAAAQFRHERRRDVHAPGFYLHLEPGGVFMGAGIWHPDGKTARSVRDAIVADPKRWQKATTSKRFAENLALAGESLKRAPRGYDPEHPQIEDLKRKDFICTGRFSDEQACSRDFFASFTKSCRAAAPLMAFLTDAVGLEY